MSQWGCSFSLQVCILSAHRVRVRGHELRLPPCLISPGYSVRPGSLDAEVDTRDFARTGFIGEAGCSQEKGKREAGWGRT